MSTNQPTRERRRRATLIVALLACCVALGAVAQQAAAVAALNSEVAEEMAGEYAEAFCRQDGPDCKWGSPGACRQQGKFQVTCWATAEYETADDSEYWSCKRQIRYTAEKRPYYQHKRLVKHRRFLGPWRCEPHHQSKQY